MHDIASILDSIAKGTIAWCIPTSPFILLNGFYTCFTHFYGSSTGNLCPSMSWREGERVRGCVHESERERGGGGRGGGGLTHSLDRVMIHTVYGLVYYPLLCVCVCACVNTN